jgi:hypothetical protein
MIPKKAFINKHNQATFVCPSCGDAKVIDVTQFLAIKKPVRFKRKCGCGQVTPFLLERRQFYRKPVDIDGVGRLLKNNAEIPIRIRDLSRSGLKIDLLEKGGLEIGDKMFVEFRLDNKQRTLIQREVVVRKMFGLSLGTEFTSRDPNNPIDKAYDLAIGFYTFS